jgi:hypothetical protein
MTSKINNFIITVVILAIFIVGGYFLWQDQQNVNLTDMDKFAKCLKYRGAVFYGAFWCAHCSSQKSMFGDSKKFIPYVECSTLDGQKQTQKCKDEGVTSYPTWKFADNSKQTGEISLQNLAEKTGCELSQ